MKLTSPVSPICFNILAELSLKLLKTSLGVLVTRNFELWKFGGVPVTIWVDFEVCVHSYIKFG